MKLLRLPAASEKCGLKKSQVYQKMAVGAFPLPIRIGERQVAWLDSELDEWIAARVAERYDHEPCRPATPRGQKRNPSKKDAVSNPKRKAARR